MVNNPFLYISICLSIPASFVGYPLIFYFYFSFLIIIRSQRAEYRGRLDEIYRDLRLMSEMITTDKASVRFTKDLRALGSDLFLDPSSGTFNIASTRQSLFQLKDLLIPLIVRYLEVIHIPILSGENNAMQFSIQDLIIHGRDILPDHITFRSTSAGDYHIQKRKKNSMKTFVTMEM